MAEEIIKEIYWTDTAKSSFNNIIIYLQEKWTEKTVENFIQRTAEFLSLLRRYPEMCRPSPKRKNVRIGVLNNHTQIIYHYKPRKKTN